MNDKNTELKSAVPQNSSVKENVSSWDQKLDYKSLGFKSEPKLKQSVNILTKEESPDGSTLSLDRNEKLSWRRKESW
jgi:hypothetical protein